MPRPPDQHEAQAARRASSTPTRTTRTTCARRSRPASTSTRDWYRDYYERNVDEETGQFPIDPAGPRVVLVPGVGIVTSGADAAKARPTRDLYHRAIAVAGRRGRRSAASAR